MKKGRKVSRLPAPADKNGGSLVPYGKRYLFSFLFSDSLSDFQHAFGEFSLAGIFLRSLRLRLMNRFAGQIFPKL